MISIEIGDISNEAWEDWLAFNKEKEMCNKEQGYYQDQHWHILPQNELYSPLVIAKGNRAVAELWLDDAPVEDYNREQKAYAQRIVLSLETCNNLSDAALQLLASLGRLQGIESIKRQAKQHEELVAIHTLLMCPAECPSVTDTDTLTVRLLKDYILNNKKSYQTMCDLRRTKL